jgi:hypothetical protein
VGLQRKKQVGGEKGLMPLLWSAADLGKKNDAESGNVTRSIKPLEK